MDIHDYSRSLAERVKVQSPGAYIASEADFERRHVIPAAWALSQEHPEIYVAAHPTRQKTTCKVCLSSDPSERVLGCPRCWAKSKEWSRVDVLGIRNTFDLVARDAGGKTLAVEVKWLRALKGRRPNGEFQRFVGQCTLAAAVHDAVIGVCGFRGHPDLVHDIHRARLEERLTAIGVLLVPLHSERE